MHSNGFDVMNSEINNQFEDQVGADVENHVVNEAYEGSDNRRQVSEHDRIKLILEKNDQLVMQYRDQLVEHFSKTLFALPEHAQRDFIHSIGIYQDRHDVVYQGLTTAYQNKMSQPPVDISNYA
ncbi:MAG: hypothetical protein K2Z81_05440 [Cyanobacteria bacterium]|nr:hypothetical protein [Cyanobacteriota bacterium]